MPAGHLRQPPQLCQAPCVSPWISRAASAACPGAPCSPTLPRPTAPSSVPRSAGWQGGRGQQSPVFGNLQYLGFYLLSGAGAPRCSGRAEDAASVWTGVKHGVQIPEQAGPVPAPAASAPRPALCQTCSWETLNGSFQAFVFWQLCFCFPCPSLSPLLGSSVYPPRLCRAPPRRPPARRCQRDEKAEPWCSRCLHGLLGSAEMLNSKC